MNRKHRGEWGIEDVEVKEMQDLISLLEVRSQTMMMIII